MGMARTAQNVHVSLILREPRSCCAMAETLGGVERLYHRQGRVSAARLRIFFGVLDKDIARSMVVNGGAPFLNRDISSIASRCGFSGIGAQLGGGAIVEEFFVPSWNVRRGTDMVLIL